MKKPEDGIICVIKKQKRTQHTHIQSLIHITPSLILSLVHSLPFSLSHISFLFVLFVVCLFYICLFSTPHTYTRTDTHLPPHSHTIQIINVWNWCIFYYHGNGVVSRRCHKKERKTRRKRSGLWRETAGI